MSTTYTKVIDVDECIESLDFYNAYTHKEGNSIV